MIPDGPGDLDEAISRTEDAFGGQLGRPDYEAGIEFRDLIQTLKLNGKISRFMGPSLCETANTMLASIQEEIEDDDLIFKLRTARQLIIACKDEQIESQQALKGADLDDETEARLKELGYL